MSPTDPTYSQWQGMSSQQRGNAISNDPGLAYRMQAAQGQSSTDSASPFRFQDPNNPNPAPTQFFSQSIPENNGGYINSPEYKRAMQRAYSPQSYYGGKGIAGYQDEQLDNFLKGLGAKEQQNADNAAAAAAAARAAQIQAMVNAIEETYGRQRSSLDTNKATSLGGITSAYDTARGNIDRNLSDYNASAASSQAAMTQRMAEQLAQMQSRDAELQNSAQLMGQNVGALRSQSTGNMDALRASSGLQEDLSRRMAEVIANNTRMAQNSGDLVRQGATGNLENQYNGLLNALMTQREQDLLNARMGGSGGGGGGGGGGRGGSDKMTSAELKAMREQDLVDTAWGTGDANSLLDALFSVNPDYASYLADKEAPEGQDEETWRGDMIARALQSRVGADAMRQSAYDQYRANRSWS